MPYYSTHYRKLYGKDSPSGRPLRSIRRVIHKLKPKPKMKPKRIVKVLAVQKKKPKIKVKKIRKPVKKAKLRKPSLGLSKSRRGQLLTKPESIHERKMVGRLRKSTGMTHLQVSHLVKMAKGHKLDVETIIGGVAGESRRKEELYEFAKRKIGKALERQVGGKKYFSWKPKEIGLLEESYGHIQEDWLRRKKAYG